MHAQAYWYHGRAFGSNRAKAGTEAESEPTTAAPAPAAPAARPAARGFWRARAGGRLIAPLRGRLVAAGIGALTERVVEFARTQEALRAARRVEPARSHAGAALAAQHAATLRLLLLLVPGQIVFSIASQLALLGLAGTTVLLALDGTITVPESIALIVVIVRYLEPFTVLAELSPGIETVGGTLRRIREVLDAPIVPHGTSPARPGTPPRIELRGIGFAHDDGTRVFDDFDLSVAPGSTTAIVGPSGSGKSTLLALLAGLHSPTAGRILVDGVDVASLDETARRELVSAVLQEPYLFDTSLRENVLVGDPAAREPALRRVAELARLDSVVARLPGGWDAPVGEAGGALSGGERQRVSIARALLAADPTPRTRVIVAHRLSSIRAADRVVFLDTGRIVEDGTITELLAREGRFAEFWRRQHAASAWRLGA